LSLFIAIKEIGFKQIEKLLSYLF